MEKSQYLSNLGYPLEEWTVLSAEEAKPFIGKEQHMNNMYAIHDPGGKTAFGNGAFVVKIEWMKKHQSIPEVVPPPAPVAAAPKAPVPAPAPVKKEMSSLLKTRLMNLTSKGWVDLGGVISHEEKGLQFAYEAIEGMSNDDYMSYIKVAPEAKAEESINFVCDKYDKTGEACIEQCKLCNQAQANNITVEEQAEINSQANKQAEVEKELSIRTEKRAKELLALGMDYDEKQKSYVIKAENDKPVGTTLQKIQTCSDEDFNETVKNIKQFIQTNKVEEVPAIVDTDLTAEEAEKTIEQEQQETNDKKDEVVAENISKTLYQAEVNVSTTGGFFETLSGIGFQQLNFTLNQLKDGKINVILKPVNFSGDPAYDSIKPLTITGLAKELDEGFFNVVCPPLKEVSGLMSDAKAFVDAIAAKEKETKLKKEQGEKVKKLIEAAKKYHDKEDFDASKKTSINTAKKKWDAVLELEPKNKEALEGIDKLRKQITDAGGTLNFG